MSTIEDAIAENGDRFPYLKDLKPNASADYNPNDELFSHETPDVALTLLADLSESPGAHLSLVVDVFGEGVKVYDLFPIDTASELDSEWGVIVDSDWEA